MCEVGNLKIYRGDLTVFSLQSRKSISVNFTAMRRQLQRSDEKNEIVFFKVIIGWCEAAFPEDENVRNSKLNNKFTVYSEEHNGVCTLRKVDSTCLIQEVCSSNRF